MQETRQATYDTLSLRMALAFVPLLVACAVAVGLLYDQRRFEAAKTQQLEQLQLSAERAADELGRFVEQLRRDTLFLAGTPRLLLFSGDGASDEARVDRHRRLQQLFLALAATRPEYFRICLIAPGEDRRELVRVERRDGGFRAVARDQLQAKAERAYLRRAGDLGPGELYLSPIGPDLEHSGDASSHPLALRALTRVFDGEGGVLGILVVNLDMEPVFERMASFTGVGESLQVLNEHTRVLFQSRTAAETGVLAQASQEYAPGRPRATDASGLRAGQGDDADDRVSYAVAMNIAGHQPLRIVADMAAADLLYSPLFAQRDSLLTMGALLLLAVVLVALVSRGLTRSLRAVTEAAERIATGRYDIELPWSSRGEAGRLGAAMRHMVGEIRQREQALVELNRELEDRVDQRTAEIAGQKALLEKIVESVADGLVVTDRDGRFLLWNRRAVEIVGAGAVDAAPDTWSDYYGIYRSEQGEPVPVDELPLVRAMRGEATDGIELYLRHGEDGDGRWVQVTGRPLFSATGEVIGGVAAMLDITQQRRLLARIERHRAELQRAGQAALRAEIASMAAHHLSQPLSAMSNYAAAARRLQESGRLDEHRLDDILSKIERTAQQSGLTLDHLRALIRREDRPQRPYPVNMAVRSAVKWLQNRFGEMRVQYEIVLASGLPPVRGDLIELEHGLIQVITNALDALEAVTPAERWLRLATRQSDAGHIVIEVEDNGPGIDEDLAVRLFESRNMDQGFGKGLGLRVANNIVESLRGNIRYRKGARGGALLSIEIPVDKERQT
jgi:PAS domain S-box-containing protein